jgi:transposase-like protein
MLTGVCALGHTDQRHGMQDSKPFDSSESGGRRRGIEASYEMVRCWTRKFGRAFARNLRRFRPKPTGCWHLDEMVVKIRGQRMWLWRAIDDEGEVLDMLVQKRRHAAAALRLLRKLLTRNDIHPESFTTDKLASCRAALRELHCSDRPLPAHCVSERLKLATPHRLRKRFEFSDRSLLEDSSRVQLIAHGPENDFWCFLVTYRALPDRGVTVHSGHIGNTFRPLRETQSAVAGASCESRPNYFRAVADTFSQARLVITRSRLSARGSP